VRLRWPPKASCIQIAARRRGGQGRPTKLTVVPDCALRKGCETRYDIDHDAFAAERVDQADLVLDRTAMALRALARSASR